MNEKNLLTIEKIPLRLALHSLTSAECLAHSDRAFFSARGKHPVRHPLMHQIDANPDCQALAICADGVPLAHCFFHFRINEGGKRNAVVHTFMTAPHVRGRGVGSLLALELLEWLATPDCRSLSVEFEFPPPELNGFASALVVEIGARKTFGAQGDELEVLRSSIAEEKGVLKRKVLSNFVSNPDFRARHGRNECFVGAVSDNNSFFEKINQVAWPPYVAVQALHLGFQKEVAAKAGLFDLLVVDEPSLAGRPELMESLGRERPDLPVAVVGAPGGSEAASVLLRAEMEQLAKALQPYLAGYDPALSRVSGKPQKTNLLGIPERESLVYFKNRNRGKRLFIAASGPSLAGLDGAAFEGEILMTVNDAIHKFPAPKYAAVMDARKLHELHLEVLQAETVFTLAGNSFGTEIKLLGTEGFSRDLEEGIYSGYTTAYFCLQLARYMGFREVYYLGLDLGNTSQRSHFFGNRSMQDRDRPEVYAKMRQSFERISGRTRELGISVFNCSPVSELKCFPFRRAEEVLAS